MTPPDIDIYRSAKVFIDQHGDNALLEAQKMEESFIAANDMVGVVVWNKIAAAIEWMQANEGEEWETVQ